MANNQYVNKVVFGNNTIIDLSSDSVNASVLVQGYTAHSHSGAPVTGTLEIKAPQAGFNNGRLEVSFPYGVYSGTMHFENVTVPVPSSGTNEITIKVPNDTTNPNASVATDWRTVSFSTNTSGISTVTDSKIIGSAEVVKF